MNDRSTSAQQRWVKTAKFTVRLVVLAIVVWGIWHTVEQAQSEFDSQRFAWQTIQPLWIALAGGFYLVGLFPCWIFWHRVLLAMGQRPTMRESSRAFWIGHLGKYVPGKAMVVVLRTELVHSGRVERTVAATSVFVETLTMMAVGAFVSALILAVNARHGWLTLLAIGLMIGAGVPTIPPLFRRLVRLLQVHRANAHIEGAIAGLNVRLMGLGWFLIALGWGCLGLSLWATLHAIPLAADVQGSWYQAWPLMTATVGLAMVAGFLSLVPGGLGVRDTILMTLLAPVYGASIAIISAILLRVVWLLSELVISGILYVDFWRVRRAAPSTD